MSTVLTELTDAITDAFVAEGIECVSAYGYGIKMDEIKSLISANGFARIIHYTAHSQSRPVTRDTGGIIHSGSLVLYTYGTNSKDTIEDLHAWLNTIISTEHNSIGIRSGVFDFPASNPTLRFWEFRPVGDISMAAIDRDEYYEGRQPIEYECRLL
jgi:hypothetical protein